MNEGDTIVDPRAEERADDTDDEQGLRFDDPYWDDAFCSWGDPSLRTCCS